MVTRREFTIGLTALAFSGLAGCTLGKVTTKQTTKLSKGYGNLVSDANGLLDLPEGFNYQIISKFNDLMSDGMTVPNKADGMGCLPLDDERVVLIRNHELEPKDLSNQSRAIQTHKTPNAYDSFNNGIALPGGTTNVVYNLKKQKVEREFISLTGTIRNCSGGVTPWGSWLTCEESVSKADSELSKDHGYIFEVPATATSVVEAKPLKAMGRFNHEAAAVDPKTGIVYLTEDRGNSLFYRFIPKSVGKLIDGGLLQALVITKNSKFDTRNWTEKNASVGEWFETKWIDITDPESPEDDLRIQGYKKGAAVFARGEGVHWADNELYFCCTNGGAKKLGQIFRYQPSALGNSGGRIQLFLESEDKSLYNFGDNLTVTPKGHLLICEDQYTDVVDNHLRGITTNGESYNFAKLHVQAELAGACFSPDGSTLFVNVYKPTKTLAIRGPW
jgi:secreted PhoX family phosphatase